MEKDVGRKAARIIKPPGQVGEMSSETEQIVEKYRMYLRGLIIVVSGRKDIVGIYLRKMRAIEKGDRGEKGGVQFTFLFEPHPLAVRAVAPPRLAYLRHPLLPQRDGEST